MRPLHTSFAPIGLLLLSFAAASAAGCSSKPKEGECASGADEALRVCSTGPLQKGVDVSVYQGTVNWAKVKSAGISFAFVRVSDGLTHPDSQFTNNWKGTKSAGVIRGVYQFFRPGEDPIQQADLMISKLTAAGGIGAGDLPP